MSRLDALAFRPPAPADVPQLAALTLEGMAGYRAFAPPEWSPPPLEEARTSLEAALARPGAWALLAEHGDVVVGHAATVPAAESRVPTDEPALMHMWALFVTRAWWGSGLSSELHRRAVVDARARGFRAMRLFTPAAQGRARRFYEREGWSLVRDAFPEPAIGLELTEYRLHL